MDYKETIDYIHNRSRFNRGKGLDRITKLLKELGDPQLSLKCIHIAGTNGKGSTTAMISSILLAQGYKVGMFTSPYLEEFEERIQINGINIRKTRLCQVMSKVAKAEKVVNVTGSDTPTEFEIITAAMFLFFHEENVDYAVIEVGLGGRLDPTNIITPLLSVITSISYDHMSLLGNSIEEIAGEKAGIIKADVPIVSYPQQKEARSVIERVASEKNSRLIMVNEDSGELLKVEEKYQVVKVNTEKSSYTLPLALLGKIQIYNCAVAIHTIETLMDLGVKINGEAIYEGLKNVTWKGRMELMRTNPYVLLDGAHNIDGIVKLAESIDLYFKYKKLYLIIGILEDKQLDAMLETITAKAEKVIAVSPNSFRAESADKLRDRILKYNSNVLAMKTYEEALNYGISLCNEDDLLVICGSLYMVGDMRKTIKKLS
ncbi:MAG TPA: bifunctional folylpolyglutamate synthase/dihydrofolate synthase [Clostridium sp.]|jgi:dihydrofolate synthase/folylpolyglutamate synthase|nr:bifunctional folylpolyglutamate synthase/dihydrofolate synthase [Clostridia bacterium]HCW03134.1 bifunctional folylpolyglutamate synthase/dihydrofolate synthase [Clostridium sp.]